MEQALAAYVGVKHCITVASGTASLEIALRALGVGTGDEVVTVPFTWISSSEVIGLVGAKPVFVDIRPETYNINEHLLERVTVVMGRVSALEGGRARSGWIAANGGVRQYLDASV